MKKPSKNTSDSPKGKTEPGKNQKVSPGKKKTMTNLTKTQSTQSPTKNQKTHKTMYGGKRGEDPNQECVIY